MFKETKFPVNFFLLFSIMFTILLILLLLSLLFFRKQRESYTLLYLKNGQPVISKYSYKAPTKYYDSNLNEIKIDTKDGNFFLEIYNLHFFESVENELCFRIANKKIQIFKTPSTAYFSFYDDGIMEKFYLNNNKYISEIYDKNGFFDNQRNIEPFNELKVADYGLYSQNHSSRILYDKTGVYNFDYKSVTKVFDINFNTPYKLKIYFKENADSKQEKLFALMVNRQINLYKENWDFLCRIDFQSKNENTANDKLIEIKSEYKNNNANSETKFDNFQIAFNIEEMYISKKDTDIFKIAVYDYNGNLKKNIEIKYPAEKCQDYFSKYFSDYFVAQTGIALSLKYLYAPLFDNANVFFYSINYIYSAVFGLITFVLIYFFVMKKYEHSKLEIFLWFICFLLFPLFMFIVYLLTEKRKIIIKQSLKPYNEIIIINRI